MKQFILVKDGTEELARWDRAMPREFRIPGTKIDVHLADENWTSANKDAEGNDLEGPQFSIKVEDVDEPVVEQPVPIARTYRADLWRRATEAEINTIETALASKPKKMQRLFADVQWLQHDDPLFTQLKAGFVQAFGQERADELLAPSSE